MKKKQKWQEVSRSDLRVMTLMGDSFNIKRYDCLNCNSFYLSFMGSGFHQSGFVFLSFSVCLHAFEDSFTFILSPQCWRRNLYLLPCQLGSVLYYHLQLRTSKCFRGIARIRWVAQSQCIMDPVDHLQLGGVLDKLGPPFRVWNPIQLAFLLYRMLTSIDVT